MGSLHLIDWIVVGLYFLLFLGIAWWVIRQKTETDSDFFLAGRHLRWFIVGTSIFASNIGSEHLVGLSGSGDGDHNCYLYLFPGLIIKWHRGKQQNANWPKAYS